MTARQFTEIPTDLIDTDAQVREAFDPEALAGLAQTIRERGIEQPVVVRRRGARFVLIIGERRFRATKLAGLARIPAIVDDHEWTAAEITLAQLCENLQRQDLNSIE